MATDKDQPAYQRELEDGREITVWRMLYNARVCIGPAGGWYYEDAWCYASLKQAIDAACVWNGEGDPPDGWVRHPRTGRRRPNNGDPASEVRRW